MTADAKPTQSPQRALVPFEPSNLNEAMQLCDTLGKSSLVPDALRGKPADILLVLMSGRDLGLTVTQAFRAIYIVKGRPSLSAAYKVASAKQHPDCEYFQMISSSDTEATFETKRKGNPKPTRLTFTIEQARKAGLTGGNYDKFPAAMLRARCSGGLSDIEYGDSVYGLPTAEEITDLPDGGEPFSPIPANVTAPPKMEVVSTTVNAPPKPKPEAAVTQRTDGHAEAPFQSEEPPMPESEEPPAAEPQTTTVPPPDNTDAEVATWVKAVEAARTPADMADLAEGLTSKPEAIRKHPKLKAAWMKQQAEIRK